jgi:hypothetical protein
MLELLGAVLPAWLTALATGATALLAWLGYRLGRGAQEPVVDLHAGWNDDGSVQLGLELANRWPETATLEALELVEPHGGRLAREAGAPPAARLALGGGLPPGQRQSYAFVLLPPAGWRGGRYAVTVTLTRRGHRLRPRKIRVTRAITADHQ